MRVWLYARLSNDDDQEMNSLLNQQEICQAFADQHGYIIVGQSFDDNVSGMKFNRRGLDELTAAVDADMIDAVIVKDLSRLGRHRTQTALFIDYLREHQVRVISATEGVDTFRDEDDLIIGVRGLMNDYYAKDIGKKIRAGYRQKQRSRCSSSILCTCRGAGRKKLPGGSTLRGERHRRSSGLNGAAERSGIRTKPVMGNSYGHTPV